MKNSALVALLALIVLIGAGCSHKPTTVEELRSAGVKAFLDRNFPVARGYFQKALAQNPSDKKLLFFTGVCFKREMSYDSAFTYLRKADLLYPRDRDINQELKPVAEITEQWGAAISAVSVLVSTGDNVSQYYHDLALYSAKNKQPLITIFYQRKLLQENPDSLVEWTRLIDLALQVDSLEIARGLLDTATAKFGQSDDLLSLVGMLRAHEGKYAESERILRGLADKYPNSSVHKVHLANVLSMSSDKPKIQEAIDILKSVPSPDKKAFGVDSLQGILERQLQGEK